MILVSFVTSYNPPIVVNCLVAILQAADLINQCFEVLLLNFHVITLCNAYEIQFTIQEHVFNNFQSCEDNFDKSFSLFNAIIALYPTVRQLYRVSKKKRDLEPETSLKSLMLRKLLDQSTFAYWALLDLI